MEISVKESNLSKFVFSILILVYHICIWGYDCTNRWFTFVCGVAMFGFLFLSEYGLTVSYYKNGMDNFWNKKFIKVYLPAIIVNVFVFIELILKNEISFEREYCLTEILMLNKTPNINRELWFLRLLFVWYVVFFITYTYITNIKIRHAVWFVITAFMMYTIPEVFGLANTYCLSFSIGVLFAELQNNSKCKKIYSYIQQWLIALVLVGSYIYVYQSENSGIIFGRHINFFIYIFFTNIILGCGALLVIILCRKLLRKIIYLSKLANMLGGMSLMIYYLQRPLVLDPMIWSNNTMSKVIWMVIGCGFVLFISYIYIYMKEKFNLKK